MAFFHLYKFMFTINFLNGITKEEIAEIITQLAFYVGWPNAWSAFNVAKKVWTD